MPHKTDAENHYTHITTTQLSPTFGAEVKGVDFLKPVASDVFAEIRDALGKVHTTHNPIHSSPLQLSPTPPTTTPDPYLPRTNTNLAQYGVLVFRKTGLDDAGHVAFSRLFGELDDVRPYLTLGRKNRFPFDELFDVSNLEDDGSLVKVGSKRHHMGLVSD